MYKFFLLSLAYFFAGCASEPKIAEELPLWVKNPSLTQAVGSSKVNFQGVYTQREEALNQAKSELSHNIKTYITSSLNSSSKVDKTEISNKFSDKIVALSEVFLSDAHQVDAYFDSDRKLYILVESSKEKIDKILGSTSGANFEKNRLLALKTREFNADELMQSRCYPKDILQTIQTNSALYQNKPVWFFRPNQDGVLGAVGIAEKEERQTFLEQKSVALALAKSSLIKEQKMQILSEHELLKIVNDGTSGAIFESSAIIKSAADSTPFEQKDIWLDPKSCELYIWIVKK